MALINCKECGKEISDQARSCPNCGAKVNNNDEKPSFGVQLICFLFPIIGVIIFCIHISNNPKYAWACLLDGLLCVVYVPLIIIIIALLFMF